MDKSDYKYVAWKTLNGWNITSRCETKDELIADIAYWEAEYALGSALPISTGSTSGSITSPVITPTVAPVATPAPTNICPVCGSALVSGQSKDGTKHFLKCSTSKWDPATKTASGCKYILWQ